MDILDLIPGGSLVKALVVAAVAAAVIGGITWGVHSYNESLRAEGRAEVQEKWDASIRKQQAEAIAQAEDNAHETQRRLERQGEAQRDQAQEIARYQRAAVDAAAARDGLQLDVDNLTAVARRAAGDTATASEREAGTAAVGVLADVSRRADAAAEVYAREADGSRRAGVLCERSYDSLISPTTER